MTKIFQVNNIFFILFQLKAVESLSSSEEIQEVTAIEKHTKVSYTKEEYSESTVRETNKYTQVQSSLDQFLVSNTSDASLIPNN